jgi:hypothetical protein
MPLPTPVLDDRTFDQLVAEARARIPRFTPEWTNFNDSDPGMTLVKLHAWLTETILYRLNKLPELNYLKFLELLNVQPRPAVAATAQLTFTLKKLANPTDPLVVLISKGTQVGVDDPDLTAELIFETERTLTALNAVLAVVIAPNVGNPPLRVVTEYDAEEVSVNTPLPFYPFGPTPQVNAVCLLGILLRPHNQDRTATLDRFPAGELDLTVLVPEVFEADATGATITGPQALDCLFPWQITAQSESIVWEAYDSSEHATHFVDTTGNTGWRRLGVLDESAALTRSGHIYLDVPGGLPVVAFKQLSRAFWADLGLFKPPTSAQELADDIQGDTDFALDPAKLDKTFWETLGLSGQALTELCDLISDPATAPETIAAAILDNATSLDFTKIADDFWIDEAGYDEPPVPYELTWFRARLIAVPQEAPQVSQFLLNTVAATAAVTRIEEVVGVSNGRPNQRYILRRTPVLVLPDATGKLRPELDLVVTEPNQPSEIWERVDDFFGAGSDRAVFALDSATGTITLGDGIHGRIPVAGAEIKAQRYRYGGGQVGNAGAGTIKALKSVVPSVDSVTNVRAATGGADVETLDEVLLRAPHDLRLRDRAVTQADFAELALQTPGVRIQRAYALPLTKVDFATTPPTLIPNTPGAVTVVILPENKEPTPQPTEEQLRLVCAHLNSRRLITTELYVIGPRYVDIAQLEAEVLVSRSQDLKAVTDAIAGKLLTYFHPLHGGEDGRGWPFGQDVYLGQVYRQILSIEGVLRVLCLKMALTGASEQDDSAVCDDVLPVDEGALVHLPSTAIKLQVKYAPAS